MQNLIVFQTVTNSDQESVPERQKKLKNKKNLIHADQLPFDKLKFSLWKLRHQSRRRKEEDAELNSLSNCHNFRWRICVSTARETEK